MKGPATELIHAGEIELPAAVPLTTPIYETTTFVFENAQEVDRLQRGAVDEVSVLALRESDGRQRRAEARRARRRRGGAGVLVGHGGDRDDPDGAR